MTESSHELVQLFDAAGQPIGARPRDEAKASGLAVGAVNVLLVNARAEVLLQLRPEDKENGGLWDKSVGGHVAAGEGFDETARREAGEELFDDPASARIRLAPEPGAFASALAGSDLRRQVAFYRAGLQLGLRDVRHAPHRDGVRNVVYHVGIYLGRTDVPVAEFRPQSEEIAELRYVEAAQVDRWLLAGRLAPNMAFVWLTRGRELLSLASA